MREYIPKYLPSHKYRQALAAYQGYEDMRREMQEIDEDVIYSAPVYRSSGGIVRPTEAKAIKLIQKKAELERQTKAVEQALNCFDEDTQRFLDLSINYRVRYCDMAQNEIYMSDRAMKRRKRQFVQKLAENLHLL